MSQQPSSNPPDSDPHLPSSSDVGDSKKPTSSPDEMINALFSSIDTITDPATFMDHTSAAKDPLLDLNLFPTQASLLTNTSLHHHTPSFTANTHSLFPTPIPHFQTGNHFTPAFSAPNQFNYTGTANAPQWPSYPFHHPHHMPFPPQLMRPHLQPAYMVPSSHPGPTVNNPLSANPIFRNSSPTASPKSSPSVGFAAHPNTSLAASNPTMMGHPAAFSHPHFRTNVPTVSSSSLNPSNPPTTNQRKLRHPASAAPSSNNSSRPSSPASAVQSRQASRTASPVAGTSSPTVQLPDRDLMSSLRSMLTKDGERELTAMYQEYQLGRVSAEHFTRRARELMGDDVYHKLTAGATTAFANLSRSNSTSLAPSPAPSPPHSASSSSNNAPLYSRKRPSTTLFDIVIDPRLHPPLTKKAKIVPDSAHPSSTISRFTTAFQTDLHFQGPFLRAGQQHAFGRANTGTPEKFVFNMQGLQSRVQELVASMGLSNVSDSAITYLGIALQQYLRSIIDLSITYADNRAGVMNMKDLERLANAVKPLRMHESPSPFTPVPCKPYAFDIEISSNPWAALDVARVREEKLSEQAAQLMDSKTSEAEDGPSSSSNPADLESTNGAKETDTSAPPRKKTGSSSDLNFSLPTNIPGRTPSAASSAATTAFLAAGGSAKSWMTMGDTSNTSLPMRTSSLKPKSTKLGAPSASVVAARFSHPNVKENNGSKQSNDALVVPGLGTTTPVVYKRLVIRDVLLALQTGPESASAGHNARGIGKIVAQYWTRLG